MTGFDLARPRPEALTWRTLVSSGTTVVALTAYGLIAGAIVGADDPQVAAKLAGPGLRHFALAAVLSGGGTLLWWAVSEQRLGRLRSFTAIAAMVLTVVGCLWFGDGLLAGANAVDAYLRNPALVHG